LKKTHRNDQAISKRTIYIIGLALLVMFIGFVFYHTKGLTTEGTVKKEALMVEYNLLQQLPGAIRNDLSSYNKTTSALVSAGYRSSKSYNEIRSFYIAEAEKNGWIFISEETVRGGGQDLGGKTIYFRKGDYTLSIQYAGAKADYGWDFAVGLSWHYLK
jgi:hypothetical protein